MEQKDWRDNEKINDILSTKRKSESFNILASCNLEILIKPILNMKMYQFEKKDEIFYMEVTMVSVYLHLAKSTVYKWVEKNYIPHRKLEKRVLFIKDHIDQWVLNNGVIVEDLPDVPKYETKIKECPLEEYHRRPKYRHVA